MNIIGISAFYHDAACCLLQDGELRAAAAEERFSRRKHDRDLPVEALRYCLREGGIDLGFLGVPAAEGLCCRPLYRDKMAAVLPPEHPLAAQKCVSLAELAAEPFILLDEGEYSLPLEAFARAGLTPRLAYKVYDDYSILAMVRQGLGVSILFRLVVSGFSEGLALRPVSEPLERTVALAWREWDTLPLAARRFADFVLKHAPEVLPGGLAATL